MATFYWEDSRSQGHVGGYAITEKPAFGFNYTYININQHGNWWCSEAGQQNQELTGANLAAVTAALPALQETARLAFEERVAEEEAAAAAAAEAEIARAAALKEAQEAATAAANELIAKVTGTISTAGADTANRTNRAYLTSTDWYVVRKAETGVDIPADILAARAAARAAITPDEE